MVVAHGRGQVVEQVLCELGEDLDHLRRGRGRAEDGLSP